jgi:acetoacetyl-CoA reductase
MKKKIALVTGGMGGIGQAICQALTLKNIQVVAGYSRDHEKAAAWCQEQAKAGFNIQSAYANIGDFNSCQEMVKKVESEIGPIDILVNNAGITRDVVLCKMEKEDWDIVLNTDLNSIFYVTRAVINGMKEREYGRIINIGSINGQRGQIGQVNYAAAKAGMHGFTKSLAREVARRGITVNTISPGYVATDMIKGLRDDIRDGILAEIPIGRFAEPHEVAHVVAFLTDDQSSYITGANIAINGGHYMI